MVDWFLWYVVRKDGCHGADRGPIQQTTGEERRSVPRWKCVIFHAVVRYCYITMLLMFRPRIVGPKHVLSRDVDECKPKNTLARKEK